jgi:hypothetical protein
MGSTRTPVPELTFTIEGAEAVPFAAAPQLAFRLLVESTPADQTIQTIALRCQIQIEATRRRYSEGEQQRLFELFGEPDRWSRTLRSLLWTHTQAVVPRFEGTTVAALQVPCTFDFNVAATKYFAGLDGGDLPLNFLFSGTVFYQDGSGLLQVMQISWDKESHYRLPAAVWTTMMDHYYPDSAWLRIRRDVFDKLADYKRRQGLATWDQAIDHLLADVAAVAQ